MVLIAALVFLPIAQFDLSSLDGKQLDFKTYRQYHELKKWLYSTFSVKEYLLGVLSGYTYVWKQQDRYLVLEDQPAGMVPGYDRQMLYQFRLDQTPIRHDEIGIGWRRGAGKSSIGSVAGIGADVITTEVWGKGKRLRQYTGFVGERPAIIRLEDENGRRQEVAFEPPNFTVGPKLPGYTINSVLDTLTEGSLAAKLELLTWLSGPHLRPSVQVTGVYQEPIDEALNYWRIRRDPQVISALESLRTSSVGWIAEGATAALKLKLPVAPTGGQAAASRLIIQDIKVGKGTEWSKASEVVMFNTRGLFHLVGRLPDGTIIDDTRMKFGEPVSIEPSNPALIRGLRQGVIGMRPGGIRQLTIPASMALAEIGSEQVPQNSDLIYEVHLVHIVKEPDMDEGVHARRDVSIGSGKLASAKMRARIRWRCFRIDGKPFAELPNDQVETVTVSTGTFGKAVTGMRVGGVRRVLLRDFDRFANRIQWWFYDNFVVEFRLDKLEAAKPNR